MSHLCGMRAFRQSDSKLVEQLDEVRRNLGLDLTCS